MKTNEHKPILYTESDLGCHIDGAYGTDHARRKLIDMLEYCLCAYSPNENPRPQIEQIQNYLEQEPSDDMSEFDEATEILQDHTADGLVWIWDSGDLILTTDDELS